MRVIISGSREVTNYDEVVKAIDESGFEITTVLSGAAEGVDALGERWAKEHNIPVELYPPKWDLYGRRAGRIRNLVMAEKAQALIAVMLRSGTRGTTDMIDKASSLALKVHIHLVDQ